MPQCFFFLKYMFSAQNIDHLFRREVFAIDLHEAENYLICEERKSKKERETVCSCMLNSL